MGSKCDVIFAQELIPNFLVFIDLRISRGRNEEYGILTGYIDQFYKRKLRHFI
jgi:hypothetical protein